DFPQAKRDYDAFTLYFEKRFADLWLASVSYTISYLRGNWAGLYRPETRQLDPNINSDFDLISLLPNPQRPLPGDATPRSKIYASKEFTLPGSTFISIGGAYVGHSGYPTSYWGGHELYGPDEAFILPRGIGDRTPWVHEIDTNLGFGFKIGKDSLFVLTMDI